MNSKNINDKSISIITVSLNSEKYIEKTLESVRSQTYKNKEHILIDGGSKDATVEIIKRYSKYIDYWVSEPDRGIADAMNKGLEKANCDYVLFLNSDDYLVNPDILNNVARLMDNNDIHIFKVKFLYEDGRKMLSLNHNVGLLTWFKMGSCHQGQIISRKLIQQLNGFDINLKINFDYDLLLRAYKFGAGSKSYDTIISVMRQVGISSRRDWPGFKERYDEEKKVHYKNCINGFMFFIYKLYWFFYIPYRYFRYLLIMINKKYIKNKTLKALQ